MGAGASSGPALPASLKVPVKERKKMEVQRKLIGMSSEYFKLLGAAFATLASFTNGTVAATELQQMAQLSGLPLICKVAQQYADAQGRLNLQAMLNLVTEWSDPTRTTAATAAEATESPAPLDSAGRIKKIWECFRLMNIDDTNGAPAIDEEARISINDATEFLSSLSNGSLLKDDARSFLEKDERFARGMTFDEFAEMVDPADLLAKTTIVVW